MNIRLIRVAALVAGVAAGLGPAGAGSAEASGPAGGATPQCAAATHFCGTPLLYAADVSASLAMTATAGTANSPIIVAPVDRSDFHQDWMLELTGGLPPGARRWEPREPAADGPRRPAPENAFLEFSPGGLTTDMCAANVNDKLVLRHCNGSNWQIFLITTSANGLQPPIFWSYFLSDVVARATGQHLAMTSSRLSGSQIRFAEPRYSQGQWWPETSFCFTGPRRPAAGLAARTGC